VVELPKKPNGDTITILDEEIQDLEEIKNLLLDLYQRECKNQ